MLSCSIWFSAPSFWVGGGLRVAYGIQLKLDAVCYSECLPIDRILRLRIFASSSSLVSAVVRFCYMSAVAQKQHKI